MKIGIISINMYSKGLNFACPLHTWAFQQLLFQHGIDNEIINYKPVYYNDFDLKHPADYYDKLYRSMEKQDGEDKEEKLKELAYKRDSYKELYCEREIRYDKFQKFKINIMLKRTSVTIQIYWKFSTLDLMAIFVLRMLFGKMSRDMVLIEASF